MVLIKAQALLKEAEDKISFRPLAGIMVLIKVVAMWIKQKTLASFRPLAGIMVLIQNNYTFSVEKG